MEIKIKVFIDTNVLISAILYPDSIPFLACCKATKNPYVFCISDYCLKELYRIFNTKLSSKLVALDIFLLSFMPHIEVIETSEKILDDEHLIRDIDDRKIYRGAINANADLLVTGDYDLLEAPIKHLKIIKPRDFLNNY